MRADLLSVQKGSMSLLRDCAQHRLAKSLVSLGRRRLENLAL
jgi:hypothetical protein